VGEKLAVIGANGIGKSTLLKTLVSQLTIVASLFPLTHPVKYCQVIGEIFGVILSVITDACSLKRWSAN
jgi:ABC-type molybdenum transport system ATPase subunit/photorepair protein PhrA